MSIASHTSESSDPRISFSSTASILKFRCSVRAFLQQECVEVLMVQKSQDAANCTQKRNQSMDERWRFCHRSSTFFLYFFPGQVAPSVSSHVVSSESFHFPVLGFTSFVFLPRGMFFRSSVSFKKLEQSYRSIRQLLGARSPMRV